MKRLLYILLLSLFASCQDSQSKEAAGSFANLTELEKEILSTFSAVDSLLAIDHGAFWNKEVYGAILIVDPESRVFYANQNSPNEEFTRIGAMYTDTLPPDINISNTAIDWGDTRWSMIMLPLPEEKVDRNHLVIHELFHRIQPDLGFAGIPELSNGHLDSYNGRLLLKLELQALEEAVLATDPERRTKHIKNALAFRQKRQSSPDINKAENALELNEGLAEYTALKLSGRNEQELKSQLIRSKNAFFSNPTFVRSFAYHTIPFYGYLLSESKPRWHRDIDIGTNLSDYFIHSFGVSVDESQPIDQIADSGEYEYQQTVTEETEREKKRIEKVEKLKRKFTQHPVLELPFQNMSISFDPRNLTPLEGLGTIYPDLRVTDLWGTLTVKNDALVSSDWSKVTVSAPNKVSVDLVEGDGWQLELAEGWMIEQHNGAYKIAKR